MNGDSIEPEHAPIVWPPLLASRAVRRHCRHALKSGYCVSCGQKVGAGNARM